MKAILAAVVFAVVCAGCSKGDKDDDRQLLPDDQERVTLHVLKRYKGGEVPVTLRTPFGVMMVRDEHGAAHFILGKHSDKSRQDFTSYEDFLEALGALPKKSVITIHDRCLMPQFYDFYPVHEELLEKFEKDCKKMGLKVTEYPVIFCTCPESDSRK